MGAQLSRRATLAGTAVAGVPLLAACGGDSETPTATDSPTRTPGSTPSPTPTRSASGQPPRSDDPVESLVAAKDVPVGGGQVLGDERIVVTQPTAGEFKGFSSTCTHQGCQVASVADGTINCPCHGSRFSIEDGSVANGPATSPLPAVKVVVEGGEVVLA